MNNIYQNNNVKNNNQQIYRKDAPQEEKQDIIFRKKIKVKTKDKEFTTILIGQTDRSYVTYDGHIIYKDDVIGFFQI